MYRTRQGVWLWAAFIGKSVIYADARAADMPKNGFKNQATLCAMKSFDHEGLGQLATALQLTDSVAIGIGVSRPMIRVILEALRKEGKLEVLRTGRGAKWKKT